MVLSGLTILKFPYLLVRHCKRLYMCLNKVMLCFCFGGSHQGLKVREVKCIPRYPAITCPVLFKGSRFPLLLALAFCSLLYVPSLSCKAVLSVLLACCVMLAGTALYVRLLVYAGLSLFIINGLYVYMVMRSIRV